MSRTTTDRNDPRLSTPEEGQQAAYLVLSDAERAKGFVRPLRHGYIHELCSRETIMADQIAQTYARDPKFYSGTFCVGCNKHFPVEEFSWSKDGTRVGS